MEFNWEDISKKISNAADYTVKKTEKLTAMAVSVDPDLSNFYFSHSAPFHRFPDEHADLQKARRQKQNRHRFGTVFSTFIISPK